MVVVMDVVVGQMPIVHSAGWVLPPIMQVPCGVTSFLVSFQPQGWMQCRPMNANPINNISSEHILKPYHHTSRLFRAVHGLLGVTKDKWCTGGLTACE